MDPRKPHEYTIELSADRSSVKDVVKGILHTIFFHRHFTPLRPATHDVLDTTLPYVADPTIESLIDTKSTALLRSLDASTNTTTTNQAKSTLLLQFLEKRRRNKPTSWFGVSTGQAEEELAWENWILIVTMTSARSEFEAERNRRVMERRVQEAARGVMEVVGRERGHIPPITTSEGSPFPFRVVVDPPGVEKVGARG